MIVKAAMRTPILVSLLGAIVLPATLLRAQGPPQNVTGLLRELSDAPGPPGFETAVRNILTREFNAEGLKVSTDGLGSVIGVPHGSSLRPRIMLAAHMDEVGGIVRYITPEGMVKFQLLGLWLDQALPDQRWWILTDKGPVLAISGLISPHITPPAERTEVIPRDDVFLDVGARSRNEAEGLGIKPGEGIAPASSFQTLAYGRYVGKALDDRLGCVMMIEILRRLKEKHIVLPSAVYFVGTVQEERGRFGARAASEIVRPDLGISLEAGIASDFPGGRLDATQERLGFGPVLYLADAAMLVNLKLRDFFMQVAGENHIPIQTEVTNNSKEDSADMQRFDGGRLSVNIAVPTRYLHDHNSEIDRDDLDRTIDLMVAALPRLNSSAVARLSRF